MSSTTVEPLPEKSPERVSTVPLATTGTEQALETGGPRAPIPLSTTSGVPSPTERPTSSGEQLKALATPKVFPGPEIKLQQDIVAALEDTIPGLAREARAKKSGISYDGDILYLGSVVLRHIPASKDDDQQLVDGATLVPTDNALDPGQDGTALPLRAKMERAIITNTIRTMIAAGQIDYLRSAGFVGKHWQVVVEIHYYRNRSTARPNLHKDTLGQTLFVNLNYTNEDEAPGPEFVVNPPTLRTHEDRIAENLPPQFLTDLEQVRGELPTPTMIETRTLEPHSVVSFVDEAVHHATPLVGARPIYPNTLKTFLKKDATYAAAAARAFPAWRRLAGLPEDEATATELPRSGITAVTQDAFDEAFEGSGVERRRWLALVALCHREVNAPLKRPVLEEAGLSSDEVDRIQSLVGEEGFRTVSIPQAARKDGRGGRVPVGPEGGAPLPLKRRMSLLEAEGGLPRVPSKDTPRRFFRTWVRAVRVERTRMQELAQDSACVVQ